MGDTSIHKSMIAALVEAHPNVRTSGFRRALAGCGEYMAALLKHDPEWWDQVSIVPDGYAIDEVNCVVTVFEIVHTHDISAAKLAQIAEIGWALDQDSYRIDVVRIDRYGGSIIDPLQDELALLNAKADAA